MMSFPGKRTVTETHLFLHQIQTQYGLVLACVLRTWRTDTNVIVFFSEEKSRFKLINNVYAYTYDI